MDITDESGMSWDVLRALIRVLNRILTFACFEQLTTSSAYLKLLFATALQTVKFLFL